MFVRASCVHLSSFLFSFSPSLFTPEKEKKRKEKKRKRTGNEEGGGEGVKFSRNDASGRYTVYCYTFFIFFKENEGGSVPFVCLIRKK